MKNFIEYLLIRLVDNPEELIVEEVEIEDGLEVRISVNPEDMGRVIGKGGQVIKAIRKLAQVKAARDGIWVRVVLLEDQAPEEVAEEAVEEIVEDSTDEIQE